jgi:hypothetical protein
MNKDELLKDLDEMLDVSNTGRSGTKEKHNEYFYRGYAAAVRLLEGRIRRGHYDLKEVSE